MRRRAAGLQERVQHKRLQQRVLAVARQLLLPSEDTKYAWMTDSVSTTMAKGSRSSMKGLWMIQPTRTTSGSTKIAICGGGKPSVARGSVLHLQA